MSVTEDDTKKETTNVSDEEEDNTKESTNDSDEDFNIDNYVADNKDLLETTAESSSIRYVTFYTISSILMKGHALKMYLVITSFDMDLYQY